MKKIFIGLVTFVVFSAFVFVVVQMYPYIFAKTVVGKIAKVERVPISGAFMQVEATPKGKLPNDFFSFAVAIQSADGVVHTASADDRQWAAVQEGLCVTAKYFPYPPWQLDKAGTFYGARLIESHVCL